MDLRGKQQYAIRVVVLTDLRLQTVRANGSTASTPATESVQHTTRASNLRQGNGASVCCPSGNKTNKAQREATATMRCTTCGLHVDKAMNAHSKAMHKKVPFRALRALCQRCSRQRHRARTTPSTTIAQPASCTLKRLSQASLPVAASVCAEQAAPQSPPQSTPSSCPFFTPSLQEARAPGMKMHAVPRRKNSDAHWEQALPVYPALHLQ